MPLSAPPAFGPPRSVSPTPAAAAAAAAATDQQQQQPIVVYVVVQTVFTEADAASHVCGVFTQRCDAEYTQRRVQTSAPPKGPDVVVTISEVPVNQVNEDDEDCGML